ncbi:MAG: hypothetical protein ACC642_07560, partial [Pseudomonadales bacterium]
DGVENEKQLIERDDVRCEVALQTVEDVLWRFNESNEGTLSVYDLMGFMIEDLVKEGFCAACVSETVNAALKKTGQDLKQHREEDAERLPRGPDDVFH